MQLIKGVKSTPIKTVVYGVEGIGKSTFASQFPNPVFIDTENSTSHMDVVRTKQPQTFAELLEQIRYMANHPEEVGTIVIDTADWAEKLAIKGVCEANHVQGIEGMPYGRGYVFVFEDMGRMLNALNECIDAGINVVITAHATIRKFEQPDELGSYDRWELKCISSAKANVCAMLKEWTDLLLFINWKTVTITTENKKKKAVGGTERVMYTQHRATFDAKNRFGLPDELPFTFDSIAHLFNAQPTVTPIVTPTEPSVDEVGTNTLPSTEPLTEPLRASQSGFEAYEDEPKVPVELVELMKLNEIHAHELRFVVAERGYFPTDMMISDYPLEFIKEWAIPCWPQIIDAVKTNRTVIPF